MKKVDFKKDYKDLYAPKTIPSIIEVPTMKFIMVDGHGNPNDDEGEYPKAVELLYALTYTLKMNCVDYDNSDAFDYVVPPLEGLWFFNDSDDRDFTQKDKYCWTSMIRQPDFITDELFEKAKLLVTKKKPALDVRKARLENYTEGLCVQCMHIGPYDTEPTTIVAIDKYLSEINKENAMDTLSLEGTVRRHHEIYFSDPRKANPATMKTILRHPIK